MAFLSRSGGFELIAVGTLFVKNWRWGGFLVRDEISSCGRGSA